VNAEPAVSFVDTLSESEHRSYDEIIEQGYSHEQAVDAIVRYREDKAELEQMRRQAVAAGRPGAAGRRKRRAKDKTAKRSRRKNRR